MIFWNIGNCSPNDTATHTRRPVSSLILQLDTQLIQLSLSPSSPCYHTTWLESNKFRYKRYISSIHKNTHKGHWVWNMSLIVWYYYNKSMVSSCCPTREIIILPLPNSWHLKYAHMPVPSQVNKSTATSFLLGKKIQVILDMYLLTSVTVQKGWILSR